MVFVTRKPGESLVLNTPSGEIVVQVLDGHQLAVDAPREVRIAEAHANQSVSWLPARPRLAHVA